MDPLRFASSTDHGGCDGGGRRATRAPVGPAAWCGTHFESGPRRRAGGDHRARTARGCFLDVGQYRTLAALESEAEDLYWTVAALRQLEEWRQAGEQKIPWAAWSMNSRFAWARCDAPRAQPQRGETSFPRARRRATPCQDARVPPAWSIEATTRTPPVRAVDSSSAGQPRAVAPCGLRDVLRYRLTRHTILWGGGAVKSVRSGETLERDLAVAAKRLGVSQSEFVRGAVAVRCDALR